MVFVVFQEGFQRRLEETIKETTLECERLAAEEAARVAELTRQEIQRHDIRSALCTVLPYYNIL